MTMGSLDYALLAKDSYHASQLDKDIEFRGVHYQAIDYADDALTGFQATAYQRTDTHEIIIAFRGTEFDRQPVRDGGVDAGMVLAGVNAQTPDALAFTQRIMDRAKELEQRGGQPVNVTVTGHSLGGTLAEIAAAKYGLKGETFNSYGAAGLLQGVPEGGHQVVDHVRATDVVSAGSQHFGEVRIYAVQQDIDTLTKAGYTVHSTLLSPRNPIKAIDFGAHAIENFVPDNKLSGHSIIGAEGQAMYHEHQQMIDRYRSDVLDLRRVLSAKWEVPKAIAETGTALGLEVKEKAVEGLHAAEHSASHVAHEVSQAYDHASKAVKREVVRDVHATTEAGKAVMHAAEHAYEKTRDTVEQKVTQGLRAVESAAKTAATSAEHTFNAARSAVGHRITEAGYALHSARDAVGEQASRALETLPHPGSWMESKPVGAEPGLDHPAHPDHALFQQTRGAVHRLDASHQRVPDQRSDNLAAALTVAARQNGLHQVHHVRISDDASRVFAVEGELKSPFKRIAHVETATAMATPVATSSARLEHSHPQIPEAVHGGPVLQPAGPALGQ